MPHSIKVAFLEDHQGIIDGYIHRLGAVEDIEITGIANTAEQLDALLALHPYINIVIMDLNVPVSSDEPAKRVQIIRYVPALVKAYPNMDILVISMESQAVLVKILVDAGVSGYILKDDSESIRKLAWIIKNISSGQTYFPDEVRRKIDEATSSQKNFGLTTRQLEILAKCAELPDASNEQIALLMGIAHSTVRNLLSETYIRLKVRSKTAAISRGKSLGLIS